MRSTRALIVSVVAMLKRLWRNRLRRMLRGYRRLKASGHLGQIAVLKQALTEQRLAIPATRFSPTVLGTALPDAELVIRQYLLVRVGALDFNRSLLVAAGSCTGKVKYPLPKEWRETVARHGFAVSDWTCAFLWQAYVGALLLYGGYKIVQVLIGGCRSVERRITKSEPHVYFVGLAPGNLPKAVNGGRSHDIVNWYLYWPGRQGGIEAIYHSVAGVGATDVGGVVLRYRREPLPELVGWRSRCAYFVWGLRAGFVAVTDYVRGHWWHALLLNQASSAAQVRFLRPQALARQYLFHNSGWVYRPLWTYEAALIGVGIVLYFYSTNCEGFRKADGRSAPSYGYAAMNWPLYLVWDAYQATFIRRCVGSWVNAQEVGPIWFQSSAADIPQLDRPALAVFDVTPHRTSRYRIYALDLEYYVPDVVNAFLVDVSELVRQRQELMLWKRKRNIGPLAHPMYRREADRLLEERHVVMVDPDISAVRVIAASYAVISMPFTSTALIAREMGKPSVYYDPTGLIRKDDPGAHAIPVLHGAAELKSWLDSLGKP